MTASSPPPTPDPAPPPTGLRFASLADVARLSGVSTGTVSRALSKPEMISEATRLRVTDAVTRLGYVANGAARALARRRTMTVGAVVPRFGSSSFSALVQALEATLAAGGYTLLLSAPDPRLSDEKSILGALLERGVDGVALLEARQSAQVVAMLAARRTPFVTMWAPPDSTGPNVGFDEYAASELLIDHLSRLGHRSIGYIGGHASQSERARRRLGDLTLAMARHGMTLCDTAIAETDHGFKEGFEAMNTIASRQPPVTAIVCGSDYLAAGALAALDQAGIEVPRRLSVASFNDNDFAPFLHPPLTTVRLPIREIGEQAGQQLLAQLKGAAPATPQPLRVMLMKRGSTGAAPT